MFLHFTDSTVCVLDQSEIKCSGEEYMRAASGEVTWESNSYGLESLAIGPYQWYSYIFWRLLACANSFHSFWWGKGNVKNPTSKHSIYTETTRG